MNSEEKNKQLELIFIDNIELFAEKGIDLNIPKDKFFNDLLPDRTNTFEIKLELEIKKILEFGMDYTNEIQKNNDKYGYDLMIYKYYLNGGDFEKKPIAFIEIEISENWKNKYPDNWKNDSFLARKIFIYDFQLEEFTEKLKPNTENTIYMIFNKSLTDSICCDMITISTFKLVYIPLTDNPYNNGFLRESLTEENKKVIRGIDNCKKYIRSFLKRRE